MIIKHFISIYLNLTRAILIIFFPIITMKKNILNSSVRQILDLMKSNNKSRLMLTFGGRNSAEVNCAISNDLSEAVESVLKRDFNNH